MMKKTMKRKMRVCWIEVHEKEIELPSPVEEDTLDADAVLEMAEDWADVGERDSCKHYEVTSKELE